MADTLYFEPETMDALAEAIGMAAMQAVDAEGRKINPHLELSALPNAASAALNALFGQGIWATRGEWPGPKQWPRPESGQSFAMPPRQRKSSAQIAEEEGHEQNFDGSCKRCHASVEMILDGIVNPCPGSVPVYGTILVQERSGTFGTLKACIADGKGGYTCD